MIKMTCQATDISIQAAEPGKLPTISMVAYTGGKMRVAGMGDVVVDYDGIERGDKVLICSDHNERSMGILGYGTVSRSQLADRDVFVLQGEITAETDIARHIVSTGNRGQPWQASISADVLESERVKAGDKKVVNGRDIDGPCTVVNRARLREVSVVSLGADNQTSSTIVAERRDEVETEHMQAQPDDSAVKAAAANERARVVEIERLCAGDANPEIAELRVAAISDGRSADVVARQLLDILRRQKPTAPAVHTGETTQVMANNVAGYVIASSLGIDVPADDDVVHQARAYRGMGLRDMFIQAARQSGMNAVTINDGVIRHVLRAAGSYAGVPSTLDVTGILGNVASKALENAYQETPTTSKALCGVDSVPDFKQMTIYRTTDDMSLQEVDSAGKIQAGTMGEQSRTNQAKTYARILAVSRHQIINDDLGAFGRLATDFGRAAARLHDRLFYTLLKSAVSGGFVASGNGNYITGAGSALDHDAIGNAVEAMMEQTDAEGNPIAVYPAYLLAGPALYADAWELYNSLTMEGASARTQDRNVWYNQFLPVISPYMSNASYVNSDTAWIMFAAPSSGVAAYNFCYINGNQSPVIEQGDVDFDTLGIAYRAYIDVGVSQGDYRGLVWNVGASS